MVGLWAWEGELSAQDLCFILYCSMYMHGSWGVICNGILGPKEYLLGDSFFFGQNPSFWNHMESPSAAATISSRGSSEVIGNARPFITASFLFLKKHNTLLQPSPLLSLLVRSPGTSLSTRMGVLSHCAIWLPAAQESLENWPE